MRRWLLVALMAASGCAMRLTDFTVISTKNVRIASTGVAQRSTGKDCAFWVLFIPVTGRFTPNMKQAIDEAIESAGPEYDALIDGVVDYRWMFTYVVNMFCYEIKGTPINTKASISRLDQSESGNRTVYYHSDRHHPEDRS